MCHIISSKNFDEVEDVRLCELGRLAGQCPRLQYLNPETTVQPSLKQAVRTLASEMADKVERRFQQAKLVMQPSHHIKLS